MYVVTGAAGFIGSNIVRALNRRGIADILVVDDFAKGKSPRNLVDCETREYVDKQDFLASLQAAEGANGFTAIFHEGACSDTMETDRAYMMNNNYEYSKTLLNYCQRNEISFLYASSAAVYGSGTTFREASEYEAPINIYASAKSRFDEHVREILPNRAAQIVGLRYFNVYGPGEQHKGRMASVAFHHFNEYRETGKVKLFQGSDGNTDGDQRRDFVSVEDVVAVNLFFLDHPDKNGIFNVGTGRAQAFNDIAVAVVNAFRQAHGKPAQGLTELQQAGIIEYIPFPDALKGKYQSFTQADIGALREAGYQKTFLTVEEGVARYMAQLIESL